VELKHAVASLLKLSPRKIHVSVKYHWFKRKVKLGEIEMNPIDPKFQKADIFAKGLGAEEFRENRKLLMRK